MGAIPTPALDAARAYLDAGWQPIPVRPYGKNPELNNWGKLRLLPDDLPRHFLPETNVGILLGTPSNGLVDVDIDHPSVKKLTRLLPPTGMIHGRPSNPDTHYWYQVEGVAEKTVAFKDPDTGEVLIELRSTGGQTVVPPSQYRLDDGTAEMLYWSREGQPAVVQAADLLRIVQRIAAIALLGKHWPSQGSRNEAALALAGCLLRSGSDDAEAEDLIRLVCDVADDEEGDERTRCVASSREKLARNEPVTGYTRLCALLGEKVVTKAMGWLGCSPDRGHQWDAPILLDRLQLPELSPELLPAPFGEFASALALTAEIPPSMGVMAVLGAVSSCVTKRYVVSPKDGWQEPVNLYVLIALPPGNNKSLVKRECVHPIDDWEMMQRLLMDSAIQQARSQRKNEEAQINSLRATAAERADVVVDFSRFAGQTIMLKNHKPPKPVSTPAPALESVMEIRVGTTISRPGPTAIPSSLPGRKAHLTDPVVTTRYITLHEIDPEEVEWYLNLNGVHFDAGPTTETPRIGTVEDWVFINMTADTHPMHMHLVTFQVIGRTPFDVEAYEAAYEGPNGVPGGIDPSPFATGPLEQPSPEELGFKDTVKANPGYFTTIRAKFELPTDVTAPQAYVYHCHIVEHEDNDMMRKFTVTS